MVQYDQKLTQYDQRMTQNYPRMTHNDNIRRTQVELRMAQYELSTTQYTHRIMQYDHRMTQDDRRIRLLNLLQNGMTLIKPTECTAMRLDCFQSPTLTCKRNVTHWPNTRPCTASLSSAYQDSFMSKFTPPCFFILVYLLNHSCLLLVMDMWDLAGFCVGLVTPCPVYLWSMQY